MKKILLMIMTVTMLGLTHVDVHAEEEPKLAVDIVSYDGSSVAIADGVPFYTSLPVTFTPDDTKGVCSYSISIDNGENFGGYVRMEKKSITLFPDDATAPDGKWRIRFKSGEEDAEEMMSSVYAITFDNVPPSIEFEDEDVADGWLTNDTEAHFTLNDAVSGISRIIARCNGSVIKEEHYRSEEVAKEQKLVIKLKDTGKVYNTVDMECIDLAGNSCVISFEYRFDTSVPKVSVSGIDNAGRLSHSGQLELCASDDSDEVYIDYIIERYAGDELVTTEGTNMPTGTKLSFDRDGRYTVRAWATDGAGNRSGEIKREFVIDGTAPVIEVEGVSESADHREGVTLTVGAYEEMYEDCEVDIKLTRSSPGSSEQIPINSYCMNAQSDIRTVDIKSDGEYLIEVSAEDAAGNGTNVSKKFRVDATSPLISVTGIGEGEMTASRPRLKFDAAELFYDSTIMKSVLSKKSGEGYIPVSTEEHVMRSQQDGFEICPEEEGRYRLICTAADRSGNRSEKTVDFAIDYTPPVISGMSDIRNRYFKSFRLPAKVSDFVKDAFGVKAGAYVNDSAFGDDDVIIEEGKYMLSIFAEDEAGNCAEESAEFIVDHTSPQIVLSGFDKNGGVRKGSIVKVSLLEECDTLKSVSFNGRDIAISPDNTATVAVNDNGEYDIAVCATDPAGNVTDTVIHTSAYLGSSPLAGLIKTEKKYASQIVKNDKNDPDIAGLAIGLISVLTGTYGLTWRASLRH